MIDNFNLVMQKFIASITDATIQAFIPPARRFT